MLPQLLPRSTSGDVAQLGERSVRNAEAEGSNPFISTNSYGHLNARCLSSCLRTPLGFELHFLLHAHSDVSWRNLVRFGARRCKALTGWVSRSVSVFWARGALTGCK